jgi:hypothetical protein
VTLCPRCHFTVDGPLHRDYCPDARPGAGLWGRTAVAGLIAIPVVPEWRRRALEATAKAGRLVATKDTTEVM